MDVNDELRTAAWRKATKSGSIEPREAVLGVEPSDGPSEDEEEEEHIHQ